MSVLTFDPHLHQYHLDGAVVPSVTQTLTAVRLIDFSDVPLEILQAARDRGTRVHVACHFLGEGDLNWDTVREEDRGYVESARKYLESLGRRRRHCEVRVYHPVHRYAGTFDLLIEPDDTTSYQLADYKTGHPADVATHLQLAAYEGALRAMPDSLLPAHAPLERLSIALQKDGDFPRLETYRDVWDFAKFVAARTVVAEQQRCRRAA